MKVLITGAAGFIGSNLVDLIRREEPEWQLVGIDDLSNGDASNVSAKDIRLVEASVLDSALNEAMSGVDAVVHLAALGSVPRSIANPMATHAANATGTLAVLEAARHFGIPYVIASSSSSVYGINQKLPKTETDWVSPASPYAVSKLATEAYVNAYALSYGMDTLAFRFFNVYGRRQSIGHAYAAVIPQFIDRIRRGEPLQVFGDGLQSRDFTHVDSVCAVLLDAIRRRVTVPRPVNLAFGSSTTILDLIAQLEAAAGRRLPRVHAGSRVGDVRASQSDGVRIAELFPGIVPVPLDVGIEDTWKWFEAQATL